MQTIEKEAFFAVTKMMITTTSDLELAVQRAVEGVVDGGEPDFVQTLEESKSFVPLLDGDYAVTKSIGMPKGITEKSFPVLAETLLPAVFERELVFTAADVPAIAARALSATETLEANGLRVKLLVSR